MMTDRFVSPPLAELSTLRTPLNDGEQQVLDFFLRNLPKDWEIYIQPHLNGLRPDFVLLNPNIGIAVFEVKDWNLDALSYFTKMSHAQPELWAHKKNGDSFQVTDNPVEKAFQYKDNITKLYCPSIDVLNIDNKEHNYYNLLTAGVIMTSASTQEALELLHPFVKSKGWLASMAPFHPVSGLDAIQNDQLSVVFPVAAQKNSLIEGLMTPGIAQELRSWLIEPDFSATQRQPLTLNSQQRNLATTRTSSGYRRIKGPAGSGKSLVLAARAAQLASEGKDVLVITYNITLWHYLRDIAVRYKPEKSRINHKITWLHFHGWCKRVAVYAGMRQKYNSLWKDYDEQIVLDEELPQLVISALEKLIAEPTEGVATPVDIQFQYDAILVDEGQDYNILWWNTLRMALKEGGEILLAADETQDLYNRASHWTEESMTGAGFSGDWARLKVSYRTPTNLIPYLQDFAQKYLPGETNLPEPETNELSLWPVQFQWIQVQDSEAIEELAVQQVLSLPSMTNSTTISYSDIVLLVPTHAIGLRCVELFEAKNIKVSHIFAFNHQDSKSRKLAFWGGVPKIKACTYHSFKGWEARYLIVLIDRMARNSPENLAAIYVALSRLKRHTEGSQIIVISADPSLQEYGQTWPAYEEWNHSAPLNPI